MSKRFFWGGRGSSPNFWPVEHDPATNSPTHSTDPMKGTTGGYAPLRVKNKTNRRYQMVSDPKNNGTKLFFFSEGGK